MSRSNFIHQVHIADGFADDCELLIHRWLKTDTLTYETFCEIWKDMQFGLIYHGRSSGAEIVELTEEVLHIAKHYMTVNTSNFEETVAGVFLVYALLNLQPFVGFAMLRISPEDVPAINRIEMVAQKLRRYDVLYTVGALLTHGPVQYHAAQRQRGMEPGMRKYLDGITGIDRLGVRPKGVFYRQNEELDIIRELGSITRRYSDAKKALGVRNSRNLKYVDEGFARDLDSSLKKLINGFIDDNEEANEKITEHYEMVRAVKEKAMRAKVDGVKFLQTSDAANNSPEKRIEKDICEIKSEPGKVKQGSPKKPVTPVAKRKAGGVVPQRQKFRRASLLQANIVVPNSDDKSVDNSSNDFSDVSNDVTNDVSNDVTNDLPNDLTNDMTNDVSDDLTNDMSNDFVLANFDKAKNDDTLVTESELDIAIESLPVFIRIEEEGKTFEIEVIDKLNDVEAQTVKKPEDSHTILSKLSEITFKKIERSDDTVAPCTSGMAEISKLSDDNVEKRDPLKLKRPERRELKRRSLKSKFKKQGMLNVANFEETAEKLPKERKKLND